MMAHACKWLFVSCYCERTNAFIDVTMMRILLLGLLYELTIVLSLSSFAAEAANVSLNCDPCIERPSYTVGFGNKFVPLPYKRRPI